MILMSRDLFRIYMQDIILKISTTENHKKAIAYLAFSRKLGTTILSIVVSSLLIKIINKKVINYGKN